MKKAVKGIIGLALVFSFATGFFVAQPSSSTSTPIEIVGA